MDAPVDGLAPIEDWVTTFESMILGGIELQREPIDVNIQLDDSTKGGCLKTMHDQIWKEMAHEDNNRRSKDNLGQHI